MLRILPKIFIVLWGIFSFSTVFADQFQGELEVYIADDFEHDQSTTTYNLKEGETTYELHIPKTIITKDLLTGTHVIVEGERVQGLQQEEINVSNISIVDKKTALPKAVSKRQVAVLLVNFTNAKATQNLSIAKVDDQLYKSTTSVRRNYDVSSFNQLKLERLKDKAGNPIIYTVELNTPLGSTCVPNEWARDAEAAAVAQGIDISAYAQHMFILPPNLPCPWAGLGHVGCGSRCYTWILGRADSKSIMAHELGHNFGLHHSGTDRNNDGTADSEYGDLACVMGTGYRRFNAPQRDYMRWFADKPAKITTVTASAQFRVNSLDLNPNKLQVLKIDRADGMGTYYISFRTNSGPFGMSAPYVKRVNIHRISPNDKGTFYITSLGPTEKFVDAANHIVITNLKVYPKSVDVDVNIDETIPEINAVQDKQ